MEVFGEHFHGNGFAVVFLEEVFCLFGDGLASFGGFGAAGEGYFFFYEGEDFFSVFVGGPEAVVGKVVPAFFGRGVVKADQEFVYVLDQVFEIVDQRVEAVYEGAELFCGILGAFAAELIFKVLPVQAAGELAGVGGGVFHVIYFAVPGQKTVLQGLFALVEEFGGEGTGDGAQPEGDYGSQDIEFHDLGIQGFVYLLLERLQGGRGKEKDSVGSIGARQEAEGGGEPGGEAVGQYAVYVFYAEIAALVVAAHMADPTMNSQSLSAPRRERSWEYSVSFREWSRAFWRSWFNRRRVFCSWTRVYFVRVVFFSMALLRASKRVSWVMGFRR